MNVKLNKIWTKNNQYSNVFNHLVRGLQKSFQGMPQINGQLMQICNDLEPPTLLLQPISFGDLTFEAQQLRIHYKHLFVVNNIDMDNGIVKNIEIRFHQIISISFYSKCLEPQLTLALESECPQNFKSLKGLATDNNGQSDDDDKGLTFHIKSCQWFSQLLYALDVVPLLNIVFKSPVFLVSCFVNHLKQFMAIKKRSELEESSDLSE